MRWRAYTSSQNPAAGGITPDRSFDPRRVGGLETTAWMAYYRRDWIVLLRAAIGLTRHTFGLPWPETLRGAWLVLRANQLWAPYPGNDPDDARRAMERFYRLLQRRFGSPPDPAAAARLEVEWWRVHREHQHREGDAGAGDAGARECLGEEELVGALAALYGYVYSVPDSDVRRAAEQRALAMDISDRWVAEGCRLDDPLVAEERAALVRSYAALLSAVHRSRTRN